jgi:hypothetical protein
VQRAIVSHDASISSAIMAADDLLRRFRTFMTLILKRDYSFVSARPIAFPGLASRRRADGVLRDG